MEETEGNITETVARIQGYEDMIQLLGGGTDRKQSDKKQGELRVLNMCILPQGGKGRVDCYVTKVESLYVHVSVCIKKLIKELLIV